MNKIASVVAGFARRWGYEVIPNWRLDQLGLERQLQQIVRKFSIETVLDVGANSGQFRDFLRNRVRYNGLVHSFEPVSHLAKALCERARDDPHWVIHEFALGEANAALEINITASDTFSSFLSAGVTVDSKFAPSMEVRKKERVSVKRGDDVWPRLVANPGKVYLKVDTQGFDMAVLRGSRQLLETIPALQFELPVQRLYQGTAHYLDILKEMEDYGFSLSGLFPIATDDHLQVVEFDCVMVRNY